MSTPLSSVTSSVAQLAGAPVQYRYAIGLPVVYDVVRPIWPANFMDRINAIPGVVNWNAQDPTQMWKGVEDRSIESRARLVYLNIAVADKKALATSHAAIQKLADDIKKAMGADRVMVTRWPVEVEVR